MSSNQNPPSRRDMKHEIWLFFLGGTGILTYIWLIPYMEHLGYTGCLVFGDPYFMACEIIPI